MEWDWSGCSLDGELSGKMTLFFVDGKFEIELPSFKVAFALAQAIDKEVRIARINEVKSTYQRIGAMLTPELGQ